MKQKKYTKRALCMSLLSMLLCCSMLIGTTFAWFTDSVTSGHNKIVAGNLDVELEYATYDSVTGVFSKWTSVEGAENLFDPEALWEPGHTEVVYLRITNKGTLALTYKLGVDVLTEKSGVNVDGNPFNLSDYLVFKHTTLTATEGTITNPYKTREEAREAAGTEKGLGSYSDPGKDEDRNTLLPNESVYGALIVYMPTDVGNEANYRKPADLATIAEGDLPDYVPYIELGVSLYATQTPHEKDSFNEDYDKNAIDEIDRVMIDVGGVTMAVSETFAESIKENASGKINALTAICADDLLALSAMDQAGMISHGEGLSATITIGADIDMSGKEWRPINGHFTNVKGNGHTISNLNCTQGDSGKSGFLSYSGGAVIEDLTLRNVTASGAQVGAFAGAADGITIKNCKLEGTVNLTWAQNTTSDYVENCGSIGLIVGNSNYHSSIEVNIAGLDSQTLTDTGRTTGLDSTSYSKEYQPYVQFASGGVDLKITGIKTTVEGEKVLDALKDKEHDTVVLTSDVVLKDLGIDGIVVPDGKTLDLGGNKLVKPAPADGSGIEVKNGSTATIKNGTVQQLSDNTLVDIEYGATATFENVNFIGCGDDAIRMRSNNNVEVTTLIFRNCTFTNAGVEISGMNGACNVDVQFIDCTFIGTYKMYAEDDVEHKDPLADPYGHIHYTSCLIDLDDNYTCGTVRVEDCTFNFDASEAGYKQSIIDMGTCSQGDNHFTLILKDVTMTGKNVKAVDVPSSYSYKDHFTITEEGTNSYTINDKTGTSYEQFTN